MLFMLHYKGNENHHINNIDNELHFQCCMTSNTSALLLKSVIQKTYSDVKAAAV